MALKICELKKASLSASFSIKPYSISQMRSVFSSKAIICATGHGDSGGVASRALYATRYSHMAVVGSGKPLGPGGLAPLAGDQLAAISSGISSNDVHMSRNAGTQPRGAGPGNQSMRAARQKPGSAGGSSQLGIFI